MSVISSFHCVDYSDVKPIIDSYDKLDNYLYRSKKNLPIDEILKYRFDSNSAWNPTFVFLNTYFIKSIGPSIIKNRLYTSVETNSISALLNSISNNDLKRLLNAEDIKSKISQMDGYRMDSILNDEYILENIFGYRRIFDLAIVSNKSVLITTE